MSPVLVQAAGVTLEGRLEIPTGAVGVVIFAHGSGSSRHSPRNQFVAQILRDAKIGTLLFDLLTPEEEEAEKFTRHLRFDIELLTERLVYAVTWLMRNNRERSRLDFLEQVPGLRCWPLQNWVRLSRAIVSRGGRPDLAGKALKLVAIPTLLIVGELDPAVLEMNRVALELLQGEKQLQVIPNARHLFEEPGTLEKAAHLAADWFQIHFKLHNKRKDARSDLERNSMP